MRYQSKAYQISFIFLSFINCILKVLLIITIIIFQSIYCLSICWVLDYFFLRKCICILRFHLKLTICRRLFLRRVPKGSKIDPNGLIFWLFLRRVILCDLKLEYLVRSLKFLPIFACRCNFLSKGCRIYVCIRKFCRWFYRIFYFWKGIWIVLYKVYIIPCVFLLLINLIHLP